MDVEFFRRNWEPLAQRYLENPESAAVTCASRGTVAPEDVSCRVRTGRTVTVAGLHPAAGGTGADRSPADMLLEALVGCAGVTLRAVAEKLGFNLRAARIDAEGELDLRGALGLDSDAPVGFRAIRLHFAVDAPESDERLAELARLTEQQCVVLQTLSCRPRLSVARA
ncbi:MAG: OsmC family peroxiredoxin [Salinarimonadaceae bacterium]|nr:MAG: OsmC family peroxiredoxin [Salinarimonadaceae bacterium]